MDPWHTSNQGCPLHEPKSERKKQRVREQTIKTPLREATEGHPFGCPSWMPPIAFVQGLPAPFFVLKRPSWGFHSNSFGYNLAIHFFIYDNSYITDLHVCEGLFFTSYF